MGTAALLIEFTTKVYSGTSETLFQRSFLTIKMIIIAMLPIKLIQLADDVNLRFANFELDCYAIRPCVDFR